MWSATVFVVDRERGRPNLMSFTRSSDIDSSWQYISQGVDVLMKRDLASLGLTTEVYMNMYTAIHNFCVSTHPVSSRQYASSGRGHHTKLLGASCTRASWTT